MSEIKFHETTAVVTMEFEVSGFEPVTKLYGSSRFVPERVSVSMLNGNVTTVTVVGGKLLAAGGASKSVVFDNRYWWSSRNDREKAPAWARELAVKALFSAAAAGLFETQRVEWS